MGWARVNGASSVSVSWQATASRSGPFANTALCRIEGSLQQLGELCSSIPECTALVVKPGEPWGSLQDSGMPGRLAAASWAAGNCMLHSL